MSAVEVTTQAQLDKALTKLKPGDWIVCLGGTRYEPLVVRGSSHVVASGSSQVEAWVSSHVVARGSSHVVAWGSSHVEARESSHVEAWESSHVVARESSHVEASEFVAVHKHGKAPTVSGGVIIDVPDPSTLAPADWCAYYGVEVKRGSATLFKAVDDDLSTSRARSRGITYAIGKKIACADWQPTKACGNGLHVSPHPAMARHYNGTATRYVQVRVKVADLVVIDDKAKVESLTVVCECDLDGEPLT